MKTKTIECYDFPEFCKLMQEAIQDGYEFDFESNERFPTSFGGYYNVILVKKHAEQEPFDKNNFVNEPEPEVEVIISDTVLDDSLLETKTGTDDFGSTETAKPRKNKKVT